MVLSFGPIPTEADAQRDATIRKVVECGDLLGQNDRVVLRHEKNPGAKTEPFGGGGRGRKGYQGAKTSLVILSADAVNGCRRLVGPHRKVRVLR
jgi:hypothetical protein